MIGVFDSGIGGLTLLAELRKTLPQHDFVYYADVKNVPYSYKTPEEILGYVENAVLFLHNLGCKVIVLACNTATNVSIEYLRNKYDFPIVAIQPAVKVAFDNNIANKRILVAATPITLKASRFNNLIEKLDINHLVDRIPLPKLVTFAQNGDFDSEEVVNYLKEEFKDLSLNTYHFMVLGCTHFTYFEDLIEKNFPMLKTVDGNEGTARHLKNILKDIPNLSLHQSLTFYESGIKVENPTVYLNLLSRIAQG